MLDHNIKQEPIKGLLGMGGGVSFSIGGSASTSSGLYSDDLFAVNLYDGTQSSQTITNGIDFSTEGGWVFRATRKTTTTNYGWTSNDTNNGIQKRFWPIPGNNALATQSDSITAFNTDGYTFGGNMFENESGSENLALSFRKAPGFFDVVTYTGDGNFSQDIPHNLGSAPGAVLIKSNSGSDFAIWHREGRGSGSDGYFRFDSIDTAAAASFTPTATFFRVFTSGFTFNINSSGITYTAFVFAHDDQIFGENADESIVYCGSFEKPSSGASEHKVTLGWEPGLVIAKCTDQNSGENAYWYVNDFMRGLSLNNHANLHTNLYNSSFRNEEEKTYRGWYAVSDGFVLDTSSNGSYQSMVGTTSYIAIRRPGHRPPTSAADVFIPYRQGTGQQNFNINYGISPDLVIFKKYNSNGGNNQTIWVDRTRGQNMRLDSTTSSGQYSASGHVEFDRQDGIRINSDPNDLYSDSFSYMHFVWKRAAKFFDTIWYKGTGSVTTKPHNLKVKPEMIIVKSLNNVNWQVWHKDGYDTNLILNSDSAWINGGPTSSYGGTGFGTSIGSQFLNNSTDSVIGLDSATAVNDTNVEYVAHLFASLDGISKVGSYTGMPSATAYLVTLGFTPRFIMIKNAEGTGDWNVFNYERGLVVGGTNAVAVALNTTNNEDQTSLTGNIRASTNGFIVVNGASTQINEDGKTYLYYAIA